MSYRDDPATARESDPAANQAGERVTPTAENAGTQDPSRNMLPGREHRRFGVERVMARIVATCGVVAIGVLIAAILASSNVQVGPSGSWWRA